MTEGIRKETLLAINPWGYENQQDLLNEILGLCNELDPWLDICENTPKDQDLLITDKSKRKYIGRLFSSGIWCTQGKMDFIPTHYKLLK